MIGTFWLADSRKHADLFGDKLSDFSCNNIYFLTITFILGVYSAISVKFKRALQNLKLLFVNHNLVI